MYFISYAVNDNDPQTWDFYHTMVNVQTGMANNLPSYSFISSIFSPSGGYLVCWSRVLNSLNVFQVAS
jgi:hypothetical protein